MEILKEKQNRTKQNKHKKSTTINSSKKVTFLFKNDLDSPLTEFLTSVKELTLFTLCPVLPLSIWHTQTAVTHYSQRFVSLFR